MVAITWSISARAQNANFREKARLAGLKILARFENTGLRFSARAELRPGLNPSPCNRQLGFLRICFRSRSEISARGETHHVIGPLNSLFKKLRRQLQRKRHIKIELCVKFSLLGLSHVDHVVQNRRTTLSLAWYEWFSCKGKE